MKKFLLIFGTFILFLISIGTMFKLMHWPGSGPILMMGMFFFSAFFLPLFFIQRMVQNKSALNIITNIFGLISTSLLFMGVLFKVMHWPGGGPMVVFGATLFILPTLILYMIQQFKEYDRKFSEFWRTVTLGVLASVFLIFWGLSVSRNILYSYLKVEDATLETNKNLKEYNEFILNGIKQKSTVDSTCFFTADNIHIQSREMIRYIEDIKRQLVQYIEQNPKAIENHWYISAKDNYDVSTYYIGTAGSEKGVELFNTLNRYKMELKDHMQKLSFENKDVIESLGDFCVKTELQSEITEGYDMTWNESMFNHQTIVGTLSLLSGIQNEVLNAEFKCLKLISIDTKQNPL